MLAHDVRGGSWWYEVEVERSSQYSIRWCYCVTGNSRGALWQTDIWHESAYETKMWSWILPCRKKWHQLAFISTCCLFMETKQWICRGKVRWWVVCFNSSDSKAPPLVHMFMKGACRLLFIAGKKCMANSGDFIGKNSFKAENLFYQIILLCSSYLL